MKEVEQTDLSHFAGNCLETCIATILEIDINEVPYFKGDNGEWYLEMLHWLGHYGLCPVVVSEYDHVPMGYTIACGKGPRGDVEHAVVYLDQQFCYDPYPGGTGLESIKYWICFAILNPARR